MLLTANGKRAVWVAFLAAVSMSSGFAIAQTVPAATPVVAPPADPYSAIASVVMQSPTAAAMVYGFVVLDRWRTTAEGITDKMASALHAVADQWRDDLREHRLGVSVTHRQP